MPTLRTVTITEVADPPAFFLARSTGTLHLVRRIRLVTRSCGPAWRAVELWCARVAHAATGDLVPEARPDWVARATCAAHRGAAELQAGAPTRRGRRADVVR